MNKRNKIIYWIATIWLSLGMLSSAIVQLLQLEEEVAFIIQLGYPRYFLPLLGIAKILGVITILVPRFPLLKEWAYAGFIFIMAGAAYSHIAAGSPGNEIAPSILLITLTLVSYFFRPENRRPVFTTNKIA